VFHEVRYASSSVIAMADMTHSVKEDADVTQAQLVEFVNDMLEQIQEIVGYSIHMPNSIAKVGVVKMSFCTLGDALYCVQWQWHCITGYDQSH